ncbi:hypothetical protein ACTFR4_28780 [Bacillus cereus group sp. MYBK181-1]|uniref:hypothetical protein n=1 Tax=unclassified Bacillus cereus group TaxID=2750818 RepID=UPI003F791444
MKLQANNKIRLYQDTGRVISELMTDRQLGAIFKLSMYIHEDVNALVRNPNEKDLTKVVLLSQSELADICGLSYGSFRNLLSGLREHGALETVGIGYTGLSHKAIVLNPWIADCNSDHPNGEKVRALFRDYRNK